MGSRKINLKFLFNIGVQKVRLDERIPHMIWELRLDNILPLFGRKTAQKTLKSRSWPTLMVFRPKQVSNIIQTQVWDHIWNSLVKTNLFDTQYERKLEKLFLTYHSIFKILSLLREPKKQFLCEKHDIVLLFTAHGTGLAPKTWKKLSSVKNETPYLVHTTLGM